MECVVLYFGCIGLFLVVGEVVGYVGELYFVVVEDVDLLGWVIVFEFDFDWILMFVGGWVVVVLLLMFFVVM